MSSKYVPVYEPISNDPPNEADKNIDITLYNYMLNEIPLESEEEMNRRNIALGEVRRIFREWVKFIAIEVHVPEEEAADVGGQLFVSGSHRLGVREPGVDIDLVGVAPRFCHRDHFFTSLKERLLALPEVTNLSAIETAKVPIMTFDYGNINIDLSFARLNDGSVPDDIDIFDDKILRNVDTATEKSLNGPRVTDLISHLVPDFDNFLKVLRCIRKWAKVRGIYGNKLGYLGGVNCNILVAFVCQLYPKASPSSLLARFFRVYNTWKWPEPILLTQIKPNPPGEQREIWSKDMFPNHMPIITPAYPSMNSSISVTPHTRAVMISEFKRGNECIQEIIRRKGSGWGDLFKPSDFFVKYNQYLCCHIITKGDDEESRSWMGLVESRLVRLLDYFSKLPLDPLHLYPIRSKTAKSENSCCYFIGFNVDRTKYKPKEEIHLERAVAEFRQIELIRFFPDLSPGCDFTTELFSWKRLPEEVFQNLGGRVAAKLIRARYLEPNDINKKRKLDDNNNNNNGISGNNNNNNNNTIKSTPNKNDDINNNNNNNNNTSTPLTTSISNNNNANANTTTTNNNMNNEDDVNSNQVNIGTQTKRRKTSDIDQKVPNTPGLSITKRRKILSNEGVTSSGRSIARTSHADIDTMKHIPKVNGFRFLDSENINHKNNNIWTTAHPVWKLN